VPPLFEPEVVARAVRHAAEHRRRDTWVGLPTVYTVLGNRVAPWFMDRYLGRTGVDGQQTDQDTPHLGSNLFEPLDAEVDRGARGPFSSQAHTHDPVHAISRHRGLVALGTAGAATLALAAALRRPR
jgi:hypothetical protein